MYGNGVTIELLSPTSVVEERDEKVGREDAQELCEGARPLGEVHLEDVLVGQRACVGPRPPAYQVPQVDLHRDRQIPVISTLDVRTPCAAQNWQDVEAAAFQPTFCLAIFVRQTCASLDY